jgi:uncharacterized protein YjbI with pentapeptide repeats
MRKLTQTELDSMLDYAQYLWLHVGGGRLIRLDLSENENLDLSGLVFELKILSNVDFGGLDLSNCKFMKSDLRGSNIEKAKNLIGATFIDCIIEKEKEAILRMLCKDEETAILARKIYF